MSTSHQDPAYLAEHEREHTALDFKRRMYHRAEHPELIRDVVAMANAQVAGPRHIVIGVKTYSDGHRDFFSIPEKDLSDVADYQQLIEENIEPAIAVDFAPFEFQGNLLAAFTIEPRDDPPFLLKKDVVRASAKGKKPETPFRKGTGWIRRGTTTFPLVRSDYERMYAVRRDTSRLAVGVRAEFAGGIEVLAVECAPDIGLPSDRARSRIQAILRARAGKLSPALGFQLMDFGFGPRPYESRSTEDLHRALAALEDTYREDDDYEAFEKYGRELEIMIYNGGDAHIEDVLVRVLISDPDDKIRVAPDIYGEPVRSPDYFSSMSLPRFPTRGYPDVSRQESTWVIEQRRSDLRHGLSTAAFEHPPLITLDASLAERAFPLTVEIRARNLKDPVVRELSIQGVSASAQSYEDDNE